MSRTSSLRKQHDELLVIAGEIGKDSDRLTSALDAKRLAHLLDRLDTILTAHLASEDRHLYPEMLASNDRKTAALASRFCEEMGGLMKDYAEFAARWGSAEAILAEPEVFKRDWAVLQGAIAFRIQRENAELYPLADASSDTSGRKAG